MQAQLPLVVAIEKDEITVISAALAARLAVPLLSISQFAENTQHAYALIYRSGCLCLIDKAQIKKGGLAVEIEPRSGEQHSWPAPKKGIFAQAIGKKTHTIVDATTGWAQDSLALFRMGYQLSCIERSPVMAELIADGLKRLSVKDWVKNRQISVPQLQPGNAIDVLQQLTFQPDCIYLDPMFPPKRKKSALAKKSMTTLRDILGDDLDRHELFAAAMATNSKRIVVKSPDYAEPLGGRPSQTFQTKLVRYDVYLQSYSN
jgi:16S rRNA (guanine1516-N2)-methyltransferase